MTKRLHLDRTEILMSLGIMFLISTLMFTLGVMVGLGVNGSPISGTKSGGSSHASSGHSEGHEAVVENSGSHGREASRRPASSGDEAKVGPGGELKKAFRDSKQRALVDMALRDNPETAPKSIADSEAHLEAHGDWNRTPAAVAEETKKAPKVVPKAPGATNVKSLFERRPASKDRFVPTPGNFTVQIGSYASADESEAKVVELRKAGFNEAYVHPVKTKKGDTWYRVAVGSFPNGQWAKKVGEKVVKRKLSSDYFVRQIE